MDAAPPIVPVSNAVTRFSDLPIDRLCAEPTSTAPSIDLYDCDIGYFTISTTPVRGTVAVRCGSGCPLKKGEECSLRFMWIATILKYLGKPTKEFS